jgi:hypothetical protein
MDFESIASANSATPAFSISRLEIVINSTPQRQVLTLLSNDFENNRREKGRLMRVKIQEEVFLKSRVRHKNQLVNRRQQFRQTSGLVRARGQMPSRQASGELL